MSARELIEQVKALPCGEQKKFFSAIYRLEAQQGGMTSDVTRKAPLKRAFTPWPDIRHRQRLIFGDIVFPSNVILDERQEEEH